MDWFKNIFNKKPQEVEVETNENKEIEEMK